MRPYRLAGRRASYFANAVTIDNAWASISGGFGTNPAYFTISFWLKMLSADSTDQALLYTSGGSFFHLYRDSTNALTLTMATPGGTIIFNQVAAYTGFTVAAGWQHVMMAVDPGSTAECYVNSVARNPPSVGSDGTIAFDRGDFLLGSSTVVGGAKLHADIADFWLDFSWLPPSTAANLAKFRSSGGKPVNLGANGQLPTGSAPRLYLAGPASGFLDNKGAPSPDFTLVSGSLADAASSPSS
ncbi:Concanavalin A-like lectin/glucanases superfamily protein [Tistlia consotensis]|uniref:Concanavalin A-like lectin/glucanases superfamily protein n=1 Tax=Tistlia consotensis USBA 355 TaxID=560819 RepID=A0A1Y6BQ72_9PROT|nr:LamG-like jellyroll fold domain-containing protein [Tistlia consotensis]SMF23406.1 Concanavalin A-like lectin/glucanases superfamily protein [Tistlia consotensis USBA 355]SNR61702.1 Concanavalin A-like lectin/glucanases superfamily protein [Tistlia consotensis]